MDTDNSSYLLFRHSIALYGVEAHRVREIFHLPELTLIADAPKDIMGTLSWRGKLLPVMHLDLRLGRPLQPCQISDSVIVLDWQGLQVGIVVQHVLDVKTIQKEVQEMTPNYGRDQQINTAFVAGMANLDDEIAVLLNPETLIRQADNVATMIWEAELSDSGPSLTKLGDSDAVLAELGDSDIASFELDDSDAASLEFSDNGAASTELGNHDAAPTRLQPDTAPDERGMSFYELYCGPVTPAEVKIFQDRAAELRPRLSDSGDAEQIPLAVVGLGETYFAFNLDWVREFINVRQVTPIPCCPKHIVGNMNLRGEVLTLVDVRTVLSETTEGKGDKAIVVEVDDIVAGIPVDAVLDVIYLSPAEMKGVPIAVSQQSYLQGMANYRDQHLSILDLSKLFAKGSLMVT